MRTHHLTTVACAFLFAACTNTSVHTVSAPNFHPSGRATFRMLPMPAPGEGITLGEHDPMLENSITNRALRSDIVSALEERGYRPVSGGSADYNVAAYAAAETALDINTYNYGYTWSGWPGTFAEVTTYERGTVIIDLIDPATNQLLWRGRGVAAVSDDPARYIHDLGEVVEAVVKKLPMAGSR